MTVEASVVELEFELEGDLFLVEASRAASCHLRLEELQQRSDGSVLEFVTVTGADPERVLELAAGTPVLSEARLLRTDEATDRSLFAFVSTSPIATSLADSESVVKQISAQAGSGRVVAEVPPHIDASNVIRAFLEQYPDATLVARRQTSRTAPSLTAAEQRDSLLSGMTERQFETIRTAHGMGYFETPRAVSTAEIADELGLASSTVSEHLRMAQKHVFDGLFSSVSSTDGYP
ncbi:helix-turn-helix domain-containing protein [Halogeometricum limi]|nr:helix-turn-helix domain-containing protein [Halogeometricum limi]